MRYLLACSVIVVIAAVIYIAALEKKDVTYQVLKVAPDSVELVWTDSNGEQLRTFPAAAKYLKETGRTPLALMNGGIFEPSEIPSGLLVQSNEVLRPVNRREGSGNFYLKPNGIFLVGSQGAAVIATGEWPPEGVDVRCAVQSGPLLLRHGKVHPQFNADSNSRLIRNGVGVTKEGEVVLIVTDSESTKLPNLYEFAQQFKRLGCDDALFLDGNVSQMRSGPDLEKPSNRFGSIVAVIEAKSKTSE